LTGAVLATIGIGLAVVAICWTPGFVSVGDLSYATRSCPLSPPGRIAGGLVPIRHSPTVINSIGAVGSGWELPACVVWTNPRNGDHTVSPPIFTYADVSDEQPIYLSTGTFIWVYDVATTKGAELLRISNSTHAIVQRVAMPPVVRPEITADRAGLWFAASDEGSGGSDQILYFVADDATEPVPLRTGARWSWIEAICAHGLAVWVDVHLVTSEYGAAPATAGYLFTSPRAAPVRIGADPFRACSVPHQTFGGTSG
jgi:hypothetical protein